MSKEAAMAMLTGAPPPASDQTSTLTPPPAAEGTVTTQPSQLQSTPFNHLAKKEAELVRQRNEFKKEQETLATERAQLQEAAKQYQAYEEAKKTDPVAALKMLGFNEADIFNYMAGQQPAELTPEQKAVQAAEQAADTKIKAFEAAQAKKEKDAQEAQDLGLIQGFKGEVTSVIQKNPEKYEYCAFYGKSAEELAYEVTLAVVKNSNGEDIITAQEAADMVEEFYEEQDKLMSSLKKRQPKVDSTVPTQKTEPTRSRTVTPGNPNAEQPKPTVTVTRSRTLHNGATSTIAAARQTKNETRDQKRDRLIEALKNGIKP